MLFNPLATLEQLAAAPSMTDGLSHDLEMELRALGCQLIQQIGILVRLPQRTMAVAQVFYQRFWYTSSMCDFSANETALGCLLLATKLEETQVSLRHLVNAFHFVLFRLSGRRTAPSNGTSNQASAVPTAWQSSSSASVISKFRPLPYDSAEVNHIREAIILSEMQILKRLGFHVQVMLPYALLVNYLQALGLTDPELKVTIKPHSNWHTYDDHPTIDNVTPQQVSVAQCAWSFLNDALQTPVLCIFGPHVVACAAIALTTEMGDPQIQLPIEPHPWWLLFDATEPEIKIAASHLLWRYHHEPTELDAPKLMDRHELRRYIESLPSSPVVQRSR
ncbi:uncharacterized protein UDID_04974 [Ustilago sp. UG-2017a]|nr:uncharacterized protein UDID_04974 [Ustilago sp. UG-2017a]